MKDQSSRAQRLAFSYIQQFSEPLCLEYWDCALREEVAIDHSRARKIANWYDAAPDYDHSMLTTTAYAQFVMEIDFQYSWILSTGFTFEHVDFDPYLGCPYPSKAMLDDVEHRAHLKIFTGGTRHPILDQKSGYSPCSPNDKFRAVHDLLGHALEGNTFGPLGEERAWLAHSKFFSPLALPAMTTETRGQNSWVNFGPHMYDDAGWRGDKAHPDYWPPEMRPFARQKVGILPPRFFDPSATI